MTTLLLILKTGDLQAYENMSFALRNIRAKALFAPGILSFEIFRSVTDPLSCYVKQQWAGENYLFAHLHRSGYHKYFRYLSSLPDFVKVTTEPLTNII